MYYEYKDAYLEIITRYDMVYKDTMDSTDIKSVESLISSGLGFWESDEQEQRYYLFPCLGV